MKANFVAKYARINRSALHKDKKKALKAGDRKLLKKVKCSE